MLYLKGKRKKLKQKNKVKIFRKFKLKKKFRFWRSFKYFFLYRAHSMKFIQLKWLFNNKRILKHHFVQLFGSPLEFFLTQDKQNFFNYLQLMELRLHVFLVRCKFCFKHTDSFFSIKNKLIAVNLSIQLSQNFNLKTTYIVQKQRFLFSEKIRYKKRKWRKYRWYKVKKRLKTRNRKFTYLNIYSYSKKSQPINYYESNYKILTTIVIKMPDRKSVV